MGRIYGIFSFIQLLLFSAHAQEPGDNIVVTDAHEVYRFERGDQQHPVVVNQSLNTVYTCKSFRTTIPVTTFYNDQFVINDVNVRVNGQRLKNFRPVYDYYSSDGVFFSDARICYFTLPLEAKGSSSEVSVSKTVLDPRYFTEIYFNENYFTVKKEVKVIVPQWMNIELKEYNFNDHRISKTVSAGKDETVYTFTIENVRNIPVETQAPGISYLAPHLLVMSKSATPGNTKITYFNTLADQYAWYHTLVKEIGNDEAPVKQKALELTKGLKSDTAKVKAIYRWVQDNIRYIAYEDGIAGFKPQNAQTVLAKKYGDCKGMANLMAQLLRSVGLDARLCWLGTNHIAYDYSTPSLSVDNHMICAWLYNGQTYYLDATEKFIGFGEIAERIQGRHVLIENGDQYILKNIPVAQQSQNCSMEKRKLSIIGNDLKGSVVQLWKGENKEWLPIQLNNIKKDKQEEVLKTYLSGGNKNYQIDNLRIVNLDNYNADVRIEYDLLYKDAVVSFGKDVFVDVDNRKDFGNIKFDTASRKLPYQFYFKDHIVFDTEINLPENLHISSVPGLLNISEPGYGISAGYKVDKRKLLYHREIMLKDILVAPKQFDRWNDNINRLNEFYNSQITLSTEKL